jgi:Domain of unknown function (DUF4386)
MERRIQLLFAWCGPVFLLFFLVGFWFVAGLVPPPSATDSAAQIASFYRANTDQLRVGLLLLLIGAPLIVPFSVLLALQLKRSDPRVAPLACVQLLMSVVTMLELLLPVVLIATAAFRPGRPPASTQLLNDSAYTILLWAFSPPALEFVAIGLAILWDRSERPLFPRWSGYFDLAVAAIFAGGAPALFVMRGAFAWDGAVAFWAVLASFGVWVCVTFATMLRAIDPAPAVAGAPA